MLYSRQYEFREGSRTSELAKIVNEWPNGQVQARGGVGVGSQTSRAPPRRLQHTMPLTAYLHQRNRSAILRAGIDRAFVNE